MSLSHGDTFIAASFRRGGPTHIRLPTGKPSSVSRYRHCSSRGRNHARQALAIYCDL